MQLTPDEIQTLMEVISNAFDYYSLESCIKVKLERTLDSLVATWVPRPKPNLILDLLWRANEEDLIVGLLEALKACNPKPELHEAIQKCLFTAQARAEQPPLIRDTAVGIDETEWVAHDAQNEDFEINEVEKHYFTDAKQPRQSFETLVQPPSREGSAVLPLQKRLLVIHGIPGTGKTTLLRICRLFCRRQNIPVAMVNNAEFRSFYQLLTRWANELKIAGVVLPAFQATLKRYHDLSEQDRARDPLGATNAEVYKAWLNSRLSPTDFKLFSDPTEPLTNAFLGDLTQVRDCERLVLMIDIQTQTQDSQEQGVTLDEWLCSLARRLPRRVLLVMAGVGQPNLHDWVNRWPGCRGEAEVIQLEGMSGEDIRELIDRYYSYFCRGVKLSAEQIDPIATFARGLPMAVTLFVECWAKSKNLDLEQVKRWAMADVVKEWFTVLTPEEQICFEAAAILRSFNTDSLKAVLDRDPGKLYLEMQQSPFVIPHRRGWVVHNIVREMISENLRENSPAKFSQYHQRAAAYYAQLEEKLSPGTRSEVIDLAKHEELYHSICIDEPNGMLRFQEMAETFASRFQVGRLQALLEDVNSYLSCLKRPNSRLWLKYYGAWLKHQEGLYAEAEPIYQEVAENRDAEQKLRAYAKCDQGSILARWNSLKQPDGPAKAIEVLESGLEMHSIDPKLALGYVALRSVYAFLGKWDEASKRLESAREFMEKNGDTCGLLLVLDRRKADHGFQGNWRQMFAAQKEALKRMPAELDGSFVHARLLGTFAEGWVYAGRYFEAEDNLRKAIEFSEKQKIVDITPRFRRDLGFTLGMQGDCQAAELFFKDSIADSEKSTEPQERLVTLVLWGAVLLANDEPEQAERKLQEAITAEDELHPMWQIIALYYLGLAQETREKWEESQATYEKPKLLSTRHYFECGTLAGRVRVKHAQGTYADIPPLLENAEALARQYEYNDHLASLRLSQGHIAWDGLLATWGTGFDAALRHYQQALVYALRYNRFFLENVLSGRPRRTPLRSIIPHCRERGEEGRGMLEALRDWWATGSNDVEMPRPDTISLVREGLALVEAEPMAWEHGLAQRTVLETINQRLQQLSQT